MVLHPTTFARHYWRIPELCRVELRKVVSRFGHTMNALMIRGMFLWNLTTKTTRELWALAAVCGYCSLGSYR